MPAFTLSPDGFRATHDSSSSFFFPATTTNWQPTQLNELGATYEIGFAPNRPKQFRTSLTKPGFELYYQGTLDWKISCDKPPYLSWAEGSVEDGLPTPDVKWILISFKNDQPPVLITLRGAASGFSVTGSKGNWHFRSSIPLSQWVGVNLPFGTRGFKTSTVRELGQLSNAFEREEEFWLAPAPLLVSSKIEDDLNGVVATWTFDRPGAIVPSAALYAPLGGYPLEIQSPFHKLTAIDEQGPLTVLDTKELKVRFPIRRVREGRFLALGPSTSAPLGTVSPDDIQSVVNLGLESLMADRDFPIQGLIDSVTTKYLTDTPYVSEPWTLQQLPYDSSGRGIDLAAAHALLYQAATNARQATSEGNALLTSVVWKRDWLGWNIWVADPITRRRAAALAAVACSLCPEPERRLDGGMLQAGLAAERGFAIYARRQGWLLESQPLLETMGSLRKVLFALKEKGPEDPFGTAMLKGNRVFGVFGVSISDKGEGNFQVTWKVENTPPGKLFLEGVSLESIEPVDNLISASSEEIKNGVLISFTPRAAGACIAKLKVKSWSKALIPSWPTPLFTESTY